MLDPTPTTVGLQFASAHKATHKYMYKGVQKIAVFTKALGNIRTKPTVKL